MFSCSLWYVGCTVPASSPGPRGTPPSSGVPRPAPPLGGPKVAAEQLGRAVHPRPTHVGHEASRLAEGEPEEPGRHLARIDLGRQGGIDAEHEALLTLSAIRGGLCASDADILGVEPTYRTPSGPLPSDHAGLVASFGHQPVTDDPNASKEE